MFAIKSKYINMPVKGCQGKPIILYKDFIDKSYTASFCVNQDLSISLLTFLLKAVVNSYTIILRVRVYNIAILKSDLILKYTFQW